MKEDTKAVTSINSSDSKECQDNIINQCIFEMYNAAMKEGYTFSQDQMADLRRAYQANDNEEEGRSSLESFFNRIPIDRFKDLDISDFTYRHILKWYDMILVAGMEKEPEDSAPKIMFLKVLEMIVRRMPKCIKSMYWEEFENKFPKEAKDFKVNMEPNVPCPSCSRAFTAMMHMPLPMEILFTVMTCIEPCPYPDSFLNDQGTEKFFQC